MVETNVMDMVATPAPQAELQSGDEQPTNEGVDSTNPCFRFCKRFGSLYYRIIASWPRTSALTFGVVVPLFLLIAVSVFFGECMMSIYMKIYKNTDTRLHLFTTNNFFATYYLIICYVRILLGSTRRSRRD